ncbi:FAD-dependent thymidylate synthase [bacterium]|nr:FAD-dependent thymidylate synthase [bacterium]
MGERTRASAESHGVDPAPVVELQNWFDRPYDNAVATARTCYNSKVIYPEDVSKDEKARDMRDKIGASTYKAGHHTTIQHPTFQFVLQRVSRQFVWSFLHSHPFYNSEQVSQRYVKVKRGNYTVPPLPSDAARELFHRTCEEQMDAYERLQLLLRKKVEDEYFAIFPARKRTAKNWEKSIEKRVFEMARYILPVATHAHLYHTISGLVLHRYARLCRVFDVPAEQRAVVEAMCSLVREKDPDFWKHAEDPIELEDTLEYRLLEEQQALRGASGQSAASFCRDFDERLAPYRYSRLTDWKANAEASLAQAVRTVLGARKETLDDDRAIRLVLDPKEHRLLGQALNLTTHGKLSRALVHAHWTFSKKLSHTADSQDQRHRMTPASRPILAAAVPLDAPDLVLPRALEETRDARAFFQEVAERTWAAIRKLIDMGADVSSAHYLLPNAVAIRFEESGDLLNLHHKWSQRLCYLAQEEIWRASQEEVAQVRAVQPRIGEWIGPPCWARKRAKLTPFCPEGDRYCGIPAWSIPVEKLARTI